MNLIRPINMSISARPPSIYDVLTHGDESSTDDTLDDTQITSFYLPKDTTKVIHIDRWALTNPCISCLILDDISGQQSGHSWLFIAVKLLLRRSLKLYYPSSKLLTTRGSLRCMRSLLGTMQVSFHTALSNWIPSTLSWVMLIGFPGTMRRLMDDETPLTLCLNWTKKGVEGLDCHKFVLQENDTGEIMVITTWKLSLSAHQNRLTWSLCHFSGKPSVCLSWKTSYASWTRKRRSTWSRWKPNTACCASRWANVWPTSSQNQTLLATTSASRSSYDPGFCLVNGSHQATDWES